MKEKGLFVISEINVIPIKPHDGLVAFASCVIDNKLYVGSIGIMTRPDGNFRLLYPTKKIGDKNINLFHPIKKEFGKQIELEILQKFEDVMNHDRYSSTNSR